MGKLINKLTKQLEREKPNHSICVDSFSDGSASWIEIRPKKIDLTKKYIIIEVLSFNYEGTVLRDVSCYRDNIEINFSSEKIV